MKIITQKGRQQMQVWFPGDEGVFWDCTIVVEAENIKGFDLSAGQKLWALLGREPIFLQDGAMPYRTEDNKYYTSREILPGNRLRHWWNLTFPPPVFMYPAGAAIQTLSGAQ